MLTKLDIAAIRAANDICVHFGARHPEGLVRLIKRKRITERDPFAVDTEHVLPAEVDFENWEHRELAKAGKVECFAMAGIYHDQHTPVSSALKSLRVGDELRFSFYPDGHSNGYVAAAGLHADVLYLHVRSNGKTVARWDIAHSICADNSARMCRGVPSSKSYYESGREARATVGA